MFGTFFLFDLLAGRGRNTSTRTTSLIVSVAYSVRLGPPPSRIGLVPCCWAEARGDQQSEPTTRDVPDHDRWRAGSASCPARGGRGGFVTTLPAPIGRGRGRLQAASGISRRAPHLMNGVQPPSSRTACSGLVLRLPCLQSAVHQEIGQLIEFPFPQTSILAGRIVSLPLSIV